MKKIMVLFYFSISFFFVSSILSLFWVMALEKDFFKNKSHYTEFKNSDGCKTGEAGTFYRFKMYSQSGKNVCK